MIRLLSKISLLLASLLLPCAALAATTDQIRDDITKRVESLLSGYDDRALVLVKVETETQDDLQLPLAPIFLDGLQTLDVESGIKIKSIEIDIFTRSSGYPENLVQFIGRLTSNYGVEPRVKVETIPSDIFKFDPNEKPKEGVPAEPGFEFGDLLTTDFWKSPARLFALVLVIIGLMLESTLLFTTIFDRVGKKQMRDNIKEGFKQVADSVAESSPASAIDALARSREDDESSSGSAQADEMSGKILSEMDPKSLEAILADCYWAELDGYARFVWNHITIEKRASILKSNPILTRYAARLAQAKPKEHNYHQDIYYLQPLPISQVSNSDLLDFIEGQNPKIYPHLSQIRKEYLALSPKKRFELESNREEISHEELSALVSSIGQSSAQDSKSSVVISIKSVEDEQEVLEMENIEDHHKRNIPTLVWAKDLSDSHLTGVLERFGAAELAQAWIAPQETLNRLKGLLPERKLKLLESYLQKSAPSRNNSSYRALHRAIVDVIENQSELEQQDAA